MKVHPAADLFPLLGAPELEALTEDIREHGQIEAAVIFDGQLLDGRNRAAACKLAGAELRTRVLERCDDPTAFVISANLTRRHLDESQRAMIAARLANMPRGGDRKSIKAPMGALISQDRAAELCNASPRSLDRAVAVLSKGTPDLIRLVESGACPVRAAAGVAGGTDEDQKAFVAKIGTGLKPAEARRAVTADKIQARGTAELSGRYRVIYADPPWSYGNSMPEGTTVPADYYPPMSTAEICDLDVRSMAEPDAVLFLWTTSPHLEESFEVIRAWGFVYKTSFVWDKIRHNMGHYNSVRHELLLVCTRGACTPDVHKLFDSVVTEERTEHSRKPETFREIIDTIYPHGERVELFARRAAPGWKVWGFEA